MKRMSFWLTREQMYDQSKDVTRRDDSTWNDLKVGDIVMAIEKGQGLKRGEKQKEIGPIEILSIEREKLSDITKRPPSECLREGFPDITPWMFLEMYLKMNGGSPDKMVKRIEFRHLTLPTQLRLF